MFGFDNKGGTGERVSREPYVVKQVELNEKLLGGGSGIFDLLNLQNLINKQVAKGYRLHTISTAPSVSKGLLGGNTIQATLVFERLDMR